MSPLDNITKKSYIEDFHNVIVEQLKAPIKHTVLLVDDEEDNLQLLKRTLRTEYKILTAKNGKEAIELVEQYSDEISLIISDQRMPEMTGTEFMSQIALNHSHIIKILLTGQSDLDTLVESVNQCDLFQYILKPFDPNELKLVVKNGINVFELSNHQEELIKDLKELFYTTIKSIANALDAKDPYTHGHSQRVTLYSLILARELNIEEGLFEDIETAGLLHDIGKIGIPQSILCKPDKLTNEEFDVMKSHPNKGQKMLIGIKKLSSISDWMHSHHEKWDGTGYPRGLKGEEIHIAARILAVADTYDAMTSSRPYRKALSHEIAYDEIIRCSGTQFDPTVVEAFDNVHNIFQDAKEHTDKYYEEYSIALKRFSR